MTKPTWVAGIAFVTISAAMVVMAAVLGRQNRDSGQPPAGGAPFPAFEGVYVDWGYDIAPVSDAVWYRWHVEYEDIQHWSLRLEDVSANIRNAVPAIFSGLRRPQAISQTIQYDGNQYRLIGANEVTIATETIERPSSVTQWLRPSFVDGMMANPDVVDSESDIQGSRQMKVQNVDSCTAMGHQAFEENHPGVLDACAGGTRLMRSIVRYRVSDRIPTFMEITVDGTPVSRLEWVWLDVDE